jgi:hypothetical protein
MDMKDLNGNISFISDLFDKSKNRQINWQDANPTTFYFSRETSFGKVKIILQKARHPKPMHVSGFTYRYMLTVRSEDDGSIVLFIDTSDLVFEEEGASLLFNKLKELYEQVSNNHELENTKNLLKEIVS